MKVRNITAIMLLIRFGESKKGYIRITTFVYKNIYKASRINIYMNTLMNLILFFLSLTCFPVTLIAEEEIPKLHNWNESCLLKKQDKKYARTAVLIIAPPKMGNSFVENRWKLGKIVWEQYMNSHPNVDCYFIQTTHQRFGDAKDQVWLDGNTIYVGDSWYDTHGTDRILHKTIAAMELLLPNYTHFVRTNLNVFLNLKQLNEYMETHHDSFYTTPLWQESWYTIGYSIMYTSDVAEHIINEYRRLEKLQNELISPEHADDGALTALATGVWPYDKAHPFRCCLKLPFGVRQLMSKESLYTKRLSQYGVLLTPISSVEEAIQYCNQGGDSIILYRTRDGLNLVELAQLYEFLMKKNYPEQTCVDLQEYVKAIVQN